MENNDLKEIQGMEGFYSINKAKIYKTIDIGEKIFIVSKENKLEIIGK